MFNKIFYCFLWFVLLFFVTLYGFFSSGANFVFENETFSDMFGLYIMPMVMAMALYLLDVTYIISLNKNNLNGKMVVWILSTIFVFMVSFVLSIFVNRKCLGWVFLIISWMSLSVMKFQTTENEVNKYRKISEE